MAAAHTTTRNFLIILLRWKPQQLFHLFQAARSNWPNKTIPLARINERKGSQLMENQLTDVCGDKADHFDRSLPSGFFRDLELSGRFVGRCSVESHQVTRHGPALFGDDALLSTDVTSSELSLSLPASSGGMFRVFPFF
jgi:hypothetical protein